MAENKLLEDEAAFNNLVSLIDNGDLGDPAVRAREFLRYITKIEEHIRNTGIEDRFYNRKPTLSPDYRQFMIDKVLEILESREHYDASSELDRIANNIIGLGQTRKALFDQRERAGRSSEETYDLFIAHLTNTELPKIFRNLFLDTVLDTYITTHKMIPTGLLERLEEKGLYNTKHL